jgi:hypothetical protein
MAYIREYYRVPAKRGRRIRFGDGVPRLATIVGSVGPHLSVRFDDDPARIERLHPTWRVEYLPEASR